MTSEVTRRTLRFTRMCRYWGSNRCMMGDTCNFAHSDDELRHAPDLVATKLCYQFSSKGKCSKGATCTFAHGALELRPSPPEARRPQEMEPMKVAQVAADDTAVSVRPTRTCASKLVLITTPFRPPPGLLAPEEIKDRFESESAASTSSPFSPRKESSEIDSEPCSPKSEIFWL